MCWWEWRIDGDPANQSKQTIEIFTKEFLAVISDFYLKLLQSAFSSLVAGTIVFGGKQASDKEEDFKT